MPTHSRILGGLGSLALLATPGLAQEPNCLEIDKALPVDGRYNDKFGNAVDLEGDTAILAGYLDDVAFGSDYGSVWTYQRQADGSWAVSDWLTASDGTSQDWFGQDLDLHGDRIAVGADGYDQGAGLFAGAVYIFDRQPGDTWTEVARVEPTDAGQFQFFGCAVDVEGDHLLAGAYSGKNPDGVNNGSVYAFERQLDGTWLQVQEFFPTDYDNAKNFGDALDRDGDRAIVGSLFGMDGAGVTTGSAYIFEGGGGVWVQSAKLLASDGVQSIDFGSAVAVDGDYAIVGAHDGYDNLGVRTGAVYVFEQTGGIWTEVQTLLPSDGEAGDYFGWSVAVDGDLAVVGAHFKDNGADAHVGASYVFQRQGVGNWVEIAKFLPADATDGDRVGSASAIDGNRVLSGAEGVAAGTYEKAGAAYLWRVNDDGWLAAFGSGTPGCSGTQTMWATRPPELGMAGMAFTCDNAPASSVGTLIVGDAADGVGSDLLGLGVLLHVDLLASNFLILAPMFSDAGGQALTPPFSVPNNPNFAGFELQVQSLWIWSTCALPPNGLSTSRGLTVRLLAP